MSPPAHKPRSPAPSTHGGADVVVVLPASVSTLASIALTIEMGRAS